jgi:hypothetical protein
METNQKPAPDKGSNEDNPGNENQTSSAMASGGESSGLTAGAPTIPDAVADNPAAAHQSWEDYERDPNNPHLTAAQEAEQDTGRPTGAIYGHEGDQMYVSDKFATDEDNNTDQGPGNAADTQTEANQNQSE